MIFPEFVIPPKAMSKFSFGLSIIVAEEQAKSMSLWFFNLLIIFQNTCYRVKRVSISTNKILFLKYDVERYIQFFVVNTRRSSERMCQC